MLTPPIPRRRLLGSALSLPLLALPALAAPAPAPAPVPAPVPAPGPVRMPALSLPDLAGRVHDLQALQGKVLMVNFWATWCAPCRAEMPSIERLYQSLRGQDFEVLGINQGEPAERIQARLGLFSPAPSFPLLVDVRREAGAHFQVEDLPTTLLFNRQGQLAGLARGARDFGHASIRQSIEALLKA